LINDQGVVIANCHDLHLHNRRIDAFRNVLPGHNSIVEPNPPGYRVDVSGNEVTDDKDPTDLIPSVNTNVINTTVTPSEVVGDCNTFLDTVNAMFSPYCEKLMFPSCSLCAPYRSVDYCDPSSSFPTLSMPPTTESHTNPSGLEHDGYWFHVNDGRASTTHHGIVPGDLVTSKSDVCPPPLLVMDFPHLCTAV
jgi:hypothetical protein